MSMHLNHASAAARAVNKCNMADDILVRLDAAGFIVNASQNAQRLGVHLDQLLVMPHIADLFDTGAQPGVTQYLEQVIAGEIDAVSREFPLCAAETSAIRQADPMDTSTPTAPTPTAPTPTGPAPVWYSLTLVRVEADEEGTFGALGTLRCVQSKYDDLQQSDAKRDGAPEVPKDSVTGLCGRRGFTGRLTQTIALTETGSVAVFAIDGMKAIYMKYGQSTADEVRWGFARFLEAVTEPGHFLAQVDDERFGVILPRMTPREAREWAADALQLFAGLTGPTPGRGGELTASAGIANAQVSAEWTMRQAELGLIMARAAGGMQTGYCRSNSNLLDGRSVERAVERAIERAAEYGAELGCEHRCEQGAKQARGEANRRRL